MDALVDFYCYRIVMGYTTYAKVPAVLKAAVAEQLIAEGFGHLVIE